MLTSPRGDADALLHYFPGELETRLRDHHVSPAIAERVLRLSGPTPVRYEPLRGICRESARRGTMRWGLDLITKGELIRAHGRAAWDNFPRDLIRRSGKRAWLPRWAVLDQSWLLPRDSC